MGTQWLHTCVHWSATILSPQRLSCCYLSLSLCRWLWLHPHDINRQSRHLYFISINFFLNNSSPFPSRPLIITLQDSQLHSIRCWCNLICNVFLCPTQLGIGYPPGMAPILPPTSMASSFGSGAFQPKVPILSFIFNSFVKYRFYFMVAHRPWCHVAAIFVVFPLCTS